MLAGYLTLIFIFIFSTAQANAETFDDYVKRLATHPQVTEILEQTKHYKELSNGVMSLPDPVITLGVDNVPVNNPSFDKFLPSSKVLGFKQQIPSYSARKAKSEKQKSLSIKQQLIADYRLSSLKAMLISMLAKLDKVKKQEGYAQKQLTYYKALEDFFKGKLEGGGDVYWRFSEVDVERSLVERKLSDLKAERDDIESELVRLVGETPNIPLPDVPILNWNGAENTLYPLLIKEQDVTVASKDVDSADAAFNPNYGVNVLYKQREKGANFRGDDWLSAQLTVSIPLWYNSNQAPKLRAAKANKRSAENSYIDAIRTWKRRLKAMSSKRDAALHNIAIFVERDKALEEMIAAAKRNYESGESDLDIVLDAQINHLSIKSQLAEQRAKHLILAAKINSYIIGEYNENN